MSTSRLLRSTWLNRRTLALRQEPTGRAAADGFMASLVAEAHQIDRSVRATIRRATTRRRLAFPKFDALGDLLEVGAWCVPTDSFDGVRVGLTAGTLLAIDDLTLFASTMDSFLIPAAGALGFAPAGVRYRLKRPIEVEGQYRTSVGRFYDYSEAVSNAGLDPGLVFFAQPREDWRLAQAALVAELAIAWVLFHEYSHWGLAHLDLLVPESRTFGFADHANVQVRQFDFETGRRWTARRQLMVGRALELLADSAAFHLLIDFARSPRGPLARFNRAMAGMRESDDPTRLTHAGARQSVRLCLTAVGIACICLDGQAVFRRDPNSSHPSPGARFMNLQSQTPMTVPGMLGEVGGQIVVVDDHVEGFTVRDLGEMIGLATLDVNVVARIASLARERGSRPDAFDPRTWHRKGWRADMRRQWRTGEESSQHESAAGRELARIPLDDDAINQSLRVVQLRRFGSLFDIYMPALPEN